MNFGVRDWTRPNASCRARVRSRVRITFSRRAGSAHHLALSNSLSNTVAISPPSPASAAPQNTRAPPRESASFQTAPAAHQDAVAPHAKPATAPSAATASTPDIPLGSRRATAYVRQTPSETDAAEPFSSARCLPYHAPTKESTHRLIQKE